MVRGIFEEFNSPRLRGFEIWLPMMKGDDAGAAERTSDAFRDERVSHIWDADRVVGGLVAESLRLKTTAWDFYLLYGRGVRWEGNDLPPPALWMAQLPSRSGVEEASLLDPGRFVREALRLMEEEDGRNAVDLKLQFHTRGVAEVMKKGEEFRALMREIESSTSGDRGEACC